MVVTRKTEFGYTLVFRLSFHSGDEADDTEGDTHSDTASPWVNQNTSKYVFVRYGLRRSCQLDVSRLRSF